MRTITLVLLTLLIGSFECFSQDIIFRQPSPYVLTFIGNDSIPMNSINYKSFRVYFKEGSYTSTQLEAVKLELDVAYNKILSILNVSSYKNGIYLVAVDSKEEMKDLMGYKIKGGAVKGHDLVFFVYNPEIRPQFKHEIFHLITHEIWGETKYRLLDEGGATYTDNYCFYDNPMYTVNAYYFKHKKLLPFSDLISKFDEQAKKSDVVAYIQSAGIFKFLYEKYGPDKMKLLWGQGFENFSKIYGFPVKDLEKEWLKFIKTVPVPADYDITKLNQGCG